MGREVRRVPADWVHPRHRHSARGDEFIPLRDYYNTAVKDWDEGKAEWDAGEHSWQKSDLYDSCDTFEDYQGERPRRSEFMPDWPDEERTHFMMYEDTSEGTPKSPAFETKEELARWLTDSGVSSFGMDSPASYEWWLKCIEGTVFTGMVMHVRAGEVTKIETGGAVRVTGNAAVPDNVAWGVEIKRLDAGSNSEEGAP